MKIITEIKDNTRDVINRIIDKVQFVSGIKKSEVQHANRFVEPITHQKYDIELAMQGLKSSKPKKAKRFILDDIQISLKKIFAILEEYSKKRIVEISKNHNFMRLSD